MAQTNYLQKELINQVLGRFEKKSDAATDLMELLSVNRDGVYRRMRGDTALSAGEVQLLATHFDISLDEILGRQQEKASFYYNVQQQPIHSFLDYLRQVHWQISEFEQKTKVEVHYVSKEIPIFIYMMFPKLLTLKLYIYGLTSWYLDYLKDRKFNFDLIKPQEIDLAEDISRMYCKINSSDYWALSILGQSLNQLEYLSMEGRFANQTDALEIGREILQLLHHCRAMAETGKKFMPKSRPLDANGDFRLFHNELTGTSNSILAISQQDMTLYHTLDAPNFLYTKDANICNNMHVWFNRVVSKSTSISVHSMKNRNYFFNRLEEKVETTIRRLELMI